MSKKSEEKTEKTINKIDNDLINEHRLSWVI